MGFCFFKLLNNERADDQDLEAQAGIKKQNELLHQLLKNEDNKSSSHQNDVSLGFDFT